MIWATNSYPPLARKENEGIEWKEEEELIFNRALKNMKLGPKYTWIIVEVLKLMPTNSPGNNPSSTPYRESHSEDLSLQKGIEKGMEIILTSSRPK